MKRELHVRFCERLGVKLPGSTHHRQGFALWYKRLERGHFPRPQELAARGLSLPELSARLEGIDINRGRHLAPVVVSRVA